MPLPKPNRTPQAIQRARSARKEPSVAEAIAWSALRDGQLGFKFRREYPVLQYRLDFYCAEAKLGIEFDGEQHETERDATRDAKLAELGIEVMRFSNREFFLIDGKASPDPFMRIRKRCTERARQQ